VSEDAGRPGDEPLLVLVTTPDAEVAAALARDLVEARLAACGNVVPGLRSIYRWEGQLQDEPEALLLLKTTRGRFEALREEVVRRHPFEVPEVVAVPIVVGSAPYLAWLAGQVGPAG